METLKNHKGRIAEAIGMSLGQGLGTGINTYFANKAVENVMSDPTLKDAAQSKKIGALQQALSPYGDVGANIFNQRLQIEQQEAQESAQKAALEKEQRLFEQQINLQKLKNEGKTTPAADRPITPDQLSGIEKAHATPGYKDMTETEKYNTLIKNNVSPANAIKEATLQSQQATREDQKIQKSYEAQKDFINDTTQAYKGFETEMKPRLLQMQKLNENELIAPTANVFREALGIPLGALEDPSSELFNKLSQDLLKGLPETYGTRILKVEVENFLKTIPTLENSAEGRRMIASNMLKLGEMKEVYYNAMRQKQKEIEQSGKPYSREFQQDVFDQVKPEIDRINSEFIKMAEIKYVQPGTTPFFAPNGEIKFVPNDQIEGPNGAVAKGGKRIW